ncbi:TPA: hypothetical protein QFM54_001850 [Enterococcus faecium]
MKKIIYFHLLAFEVSLIYVFYLLVAGDFKSKAMYGLIGSILFLILTIIFLYITKGNLPKKSSKNREIIGNSQQSENRLLIQLEKEFGFTLSELIDGRKSFFTQQDLRVVSDYLEIREGTAFKSSIIGGSSMIFESVNKTIVLEIIESQVKVLFDENIHFEVLANGMPIQELKEIVR